MNQCINTVICDDVLDGLKKIENNSVSLIFTSPPYNVGMLYGNHNDRMTYSDYLDWLKTIFLECRRVLKTGGRLAVNIDMTRNIEDDSKEYSHPIYADLININRENDFLFRTEICWYKQNVVGRATAWGSYKSPKNPIVRRIHEYILVWSKDQYGLDGDGVSDLTKEEFCNYTLSTWFVQPETKKRGGHPCPFPVELPRRAIKLFTFQNDIVLDPFAGIGTTCVAAKILGRRYIGIDNNQSFVDYADKRLISEQDIFQ